MTDNMNIIGVAIYPSYADGLGCDGADDGKAAEDR